MIEAEGAGLPRRLRSVTAERDGKLARKVVAMRVYETDIDDAWNALTTRERIERWFMPIEGDLRLGGRYQLKGNAGGTITTCDAPEHLAATWEMGGEVSWVDVHLEKVAAKMTKLTLEHTAHVDDERWNQFGPGAVGVGWELGLLGLHLHLIGGKAKDVTVEGQEWAGSEEGKQFIAQSSDGWGEASIKGGTDPTKARAAAKNTTAFYTGG